MSPLVRRTTLVVVSVALVATGCSNTAPTKRGSSAAPVSTENSAPPSTAAPAAPVSTSPPPTKVGSLMAPAGAEVAAAKQLLVTGQDYGNGWTEVDGERTLRFPPEGRPFCDTDPPKSDAAKRFSVSWDVTYLADPRSTFNHDITLYRPGTANRAVDEINALLSSSCKPFVDDFNGDRVEYAAKSTGRNTADVTWTLGNHARRGALRFGRRGSYLSMVLAFGKTTAAARTIADRVAAMADNKFTAAGLD